MSSSSDDSGGQDQDPQPFSAPPPYQYPQYQNPQYQYPQYQNPQYQNPQYQNPQYQNPQYQNPQYQNPQYQNPQYANPQGGGSYYPAGGLPGQPVYPYGGPPPASGMNGLAIAGFVTAFFCSIVGLVLSIVSYNQCKERNQAGQGLALAGIIISVISLIGGIAVLSSR